MGYICHYSLYAYENELKQGFITVEGADNFELYSVAGQKLNLNSTLQKGVYLVKVKSSGTEKSFKVVKEFFFV